MESFRVLPLALFVRIVVISLDFIIYHYPFKMSGLRAAKSESEKIKERPRQDDPVDENAGAISTSVGVNAVRKKITAKDVNNNNSENLKKLTSPIDGDVDDVNDDDIDAEETDVKAVIDSSIKDAKIPIHQGASI